ncbi:MAG: hypothetical protein Q9O62_14580 [Ardenticatenia bacterium]|nr:hypothetical protein [Ardenticatenia bacterium]
MDHSGRRRRFHILVLIALLVWFTFIVAELGRGRTVLFITSALGFDPTPTAGAQVLTTPTTTLPVASPTATPTRFPSPTPPAVHDRVRGPTR